MKNYSSDILLVILVNSGHHHSPQVSIGNCKSASLNEHLEHTVKYIAQEEFVITFKDRDYQ